MAATVVEVLEALAAQLRGAGIRTYERPADITSAPCAFLLVEAVDYQNAFALGDPRITMVVTAVVARTDDRNAYRRLSDAIAPTGAQSLRQIIESDRTLGGVCQTLIVQRADNIRMISQSDAEYLAVDVSLLVHA